MADDPEAIAQLARLLREERLRAGTTVEPGSLIDERFGLLVDGLLAEAAASDDVFDRESALAFITQRLRFFGPLIDDARRTRLMQALQAKIEAW